MSSWFDRLLEDLQRRQQEQDARREGRPFERERNVTPMERARRRTGGGPPGNGGDGSGRGNGGDWTFPPMGDAGRSIRRWVTIIVAIVVLFIALGLVGGLVTLVTDLAWYDALGRRDVLTTRLWSQVGLFFVGLVGFAIPALASIWIARRIAPRVPVRRLGWLDLPDASRIITLALAGVALLFALGSGAAWQGDWEQILLFLNGGEWGVPDPTLGRDVGFYIFDLPVLRFAQGWAISSLIVIGLLTLGVYAAGALRWQLRLTAPVRAHLSIIGALLLVAIAAGYQLDIADLAYSTRGIDGTIQAATYTDVNAQVPAFAILTVVALLAAALLLLNTWFRTLWLLGLAAAGWLALSIIVGGLYPAFVQNISVAPNELAVEREFIRNHIQSTRAAMDLDDVELAPFTGEEPLTRELFTDNQATIDNLRLWDYRPLLDTIGQQQNLVRYYTFNDVDIDRYEIDGKSRQIMLSARELDIERLQEAARNWTNERLVYTHGYGITAVPVDAVTPQGQPDYLVSGINREPELPLAQPRIYFGELTDSWVVTGTTTDELDYPLQDESIATTSWTGSTGVGIGGFFNRLLYAIRFGDLNLLISNQLTDDSQILFRRSITERVPELAPFLAYDRDPYLVATGEELVWVWDAYTVTDRYPNAQPIPTGEPFAGANYVRNSVKVVMDAYDGSVRFFLADPDDPIAATYARIFPTLFEPMSAMPDELVAHLRYPEDLFTAQNAQYLLYHVPATDSGAGTLYSQEDRWAFADLGDEAGAREALEPYYVIMRIPGQENAEFVLIQPMVAIGRQNMVAWVAARMDPDVYGERISFRFPSDVTTQGPAQVQSRIETNTAISQQFTLWEGAGSTVIRGNLLVLPMGDGVLYAEPIFLRSTQARFPQFVKVVLVGESRVAFADTIDQALRQVLGEAAIPPPEEGPPDGGGEEPGELPSDVAGLVAEAQRLYQQAQAALTEGDLGTYQDRIDELESVLEALAELTGASPVPSPSP
jgi:uncharacterized membrane protein (UPF0182 family)